MALVYSSYERIQERIILLVNLESTMKSFVLPDLNVVPVTLIRCPFCFAEWLKTHFHYRSLSTKLSKQYSFLVTYFKDHWVNTGKRIRFQGVIG
jgi:hypothetical protein